jgi:hypothetical protein
MRNKAINVAPPSTFKNNLLDANIVDEELVVWTAAVDLVADAEADEAAAAEVDVDDAAATDVDAEEEVEDVTLVVVVPLAVVVGVPLVVVLEAVVAAPLVEALVVAAALDDAALLTAPENPPTAPPLGVSLEEVPFAPLWKAENVSSDYDIISLAM